MNFYKDSIIFTVVSFFVNSSLEFKTGIKFVINGIHRKQEKMLVSL